MHSERLLAELADDISANGLLEAILLYEGAVLDGRNRLKACLIAGVDPVFVDFVGDPYALVRSKNAMRRDLSPDQRRACLVDLHDLEATHWKNRHTLASETVSEPKAKQSVAADSVAKAMGESARPVTGPAACVSRGPSRLGARA